MGILVNENQIGGGTSNSSHNIGDIFYTTRTDNSLNGAVECNGSQYNFSDFDSNLQSLFDDGKLPYLPISEFDSMVTNQGGCDSFGYGADDSFYGWTSMYGGPYYTKSETPKMNDDLYVKEDNLMVYYGVVYGFSETYGVQIDVDGHYAGRESSLDEIDDTPTTYFKVPKKLSRVLVRTQKPTADNNYTWYNVYADGWVEQGGKGSTSASTAITFLIPMATSHYALSFGGNGASTNRNCFLLAGYNRTSTGFTLHAVVVNANSQTSGTGTDSSTWICAGYAAPSEYTKDKWNYQNVQVERPMVQLFNGNTDTALATCTSVLADVSTLNSQYSALMNQDSVIYWYSPLSNNNNPHPDIVVYLAWYRIYKSGWVVQGGTMQVLSGTTDISLPIEMAGGYLQYDAHVNAGVQSSNARNVQVLDSSTSTTLKIISNSGFDIFWRVEGQSNIL